MDSEICNVMLAGLIYKLFCLFCHVLDTVARPHFSICLLWRHNPRFLFKLECRPVHGLPTLQSFKIDSYQLNGNSLTLSSASDLSLYQSTLLTPQLMPCLYDHSVFSLGPLEKVFRLFCFYRVSLLKCMLSQEKRPDVVHQLDCGTDYYILFDGKELQHSDQLCSTFHSCGTEIQLTRLA